MQQSEAAYQRTDVLTTMQREAHQIPVPSAATDTSQQTGTIGNISEVSGSHNSFVVGARGVSITNIFPLQGPGVPAPRPQLSERPDQEPRLGTPSYQDVGNKTRDILKERYKTTGSYVQLLPGVANDQKHIASIYTKVRLQTREGVAVVCTPTGKTATKSSQRGEIVNSIEYAKIFRLKKRTKKLIKRLIFVGEGGVGKSTIFDKIVNDWAEGKSKFLKRFHLVFLLKMCALRQESDLVESMLNQLLDEDSGIEKDELEKVIQAEPNEVLILLDGFDEMMTKTLNEASFGSILKALNRKKYRHCCICVSTRPSRLETLMSTSLVQNPCTHVEVLGFAKEDVNEYIRKFFKEDADIDNSNALIKSVEMSNTLRDFAKIPMLLLLMCLLWRENEQLPKTTSRLFNKAVDHMFSTKDEDRERPPDAKKRKPNISNVSKTVPIEIGQIALRGLMSDQFSFQEDEFKPEALHLALKAGILTKHSVVKNLKSHNSIQFMHTMQQYCAAKYLQTLEKGEFQRSLEPLCSTIDRVISNEYLLRFCSGDNEECMTDIVNLLGRSKFDEDKHSFKSYIINTICRNCFFESQSERVPRGLTSNTHIPSTIEVRNNNDSHSLVYFLEIICRSDSGKAQLTCVKCIQVWSASSVSDLAFALGYMKNLSILKLDECPLGNSALGKILSELKCNKQLTCIDLSICDGLGGRAVEWAPHIKHLTSLIKLIIWECKLQAADIEHIASSVSDIPSLTHLSLAYNYKLGGTASTWSTELPKMTHINELDLAGCDLTPTDIKYIASAVGDMPSLTDLILDENEILSELAESWAKELPKMTHLKKLNLGRCNLSRTDMKHIAKAVGDMPSLTDLDISENTFGGSLWAKELPKMKHLNKLNLAVCGLSRTDMKHIAKAVGDMPSLTDLNISENTFGGSLWAKELPKMKHLNKLNLGSCDLSQTDMKYIVSAVGDMPRLTDLIIARNKFGGLLWAEELPKMKHLNKLNLRYCRLSPTDMKHIASAVGDMPSLTDLAISGNPFGGLLWAKELPKMKHLKKLDLIWCKLSPTDMKHIATAVSDMPSLTDLYLSGNYIFGGLDKFGLQSCSPSLKVHMDW
ncbi:NACHT, LRR and PYD domains-containing protein 3-like [Patiria miniata]|uniref:NACHT domain-containing protein n=1 Tax=Patiria miniata TaxID=46514 RepID=A0A913Z4H0_PATMI|nr:NACHT, LRR and PYD domains-containing protein 3-like [Patiria miniata]